MSSDRVRTALAKVTAALPAAEDRPGQQRDGDSGERGHRGGKHLIVQAGTGTGKTMGYLVPAVLAGKRVVVATATKALQDQLAAKDLPFLEAHLGMPFDWAVLKGRSNYICMQRVRELQSTDGQGQLEIEEFAATTKVEVKRLCEWAGTTKTGDQADLTWSPADRSWQAVSVGSDECPGATKCPMGGVCFAELARARASVADVVVVNLHLYGLNVASGNMLLPEHDVVVIDEAHQLEDIMSDTVGVQIGPGRFTNLAAVVRRVIDDPAIVGGLAEAAPAIREALRPFAGERLSKPFPDAIQDVLIDARGRIEKAQTASAPSTPTCPRPSSARCAPSRSRPGCRSRSTSRSARTRDTSPSCRAVPTTPGWRSLRSTSAPCWRRGSGRSARPSSPAQRCPQRSPIVSGLRMGRTPRSMSGARSTTATNALLYCALHLPDPRSPQFAARSARRAGGVDHCGGWPHPGAVHQLEGDGRRRGGGEGTRSTCGSSPSATCPRRHWSRRSRDDESSCLFATAGFFQGVDIPGRTLSLVTIDRIPFPGPDDPLLTARRELLGASAFSEIDLPRAAMLLAQATGRLIRNATDRGVVAVFDPRSARPATAGRSSRRSPRCDEHGSAADVEAFLREITT